jgi:hypothetical protein
MDSTKNQQEATKPAKGVVVLGLKCYQGVIKKTKKKKYFYETT